MEKQIEMRGGYWLKGLWAFSVVAAFAIGRETVPTKTETVTEVQEKIVEVKTIQYVEVEKRVESKAKERVVYKEKIVNVDGSTVERETEVDRESQRLALETTKQFQENVDRSVARREAARKTVERKQDQWHVTGTYFNPASYGLSVERRVLGPLHVGVTGILNNSSPAIGLSVGVSF